MKVFGNVSILENNLKKLIENLACCTLHFSSVSTILPVRSFPSTVVLQSAQAFPDPSFCVTRARQLEGFVVLVLVIVNNLHYQDKSLAYIL